MNHQMKPEDHKDVRVTLTTRIWIFATIMLAIGMPAFPGSGSVAGVGHIIIDLAILAAAGFGTGAIWGTFDGRARRVLPPASDDTSDIKRLEERLSNLEMISAYERMLHSEEEKSGLSHRVASPNQAGEPTPKVKLSLR